LQGLSGIAVGGLIPSVAALMNLWAPGGSQGATYGLDNSVQASARVVAPMVAAALAAWVGYHAVFAGAAVIYGGAVVVAWVVVRNLAATASDRETPG
ncbi:MAG: MFS transporter, partial [Caldilineaceae bacterium]|nr:MFS transporter [Caldilineaceae bacterium]